MTITNTFQITKVGGTTFNLFDKTRPSAVTAASQRVDFLSTDTVDVAVKSGKKLTFDIGDKISIFGRDYTLNIPAVEKKTGPNIFTYNLQFEGLQYDLLRATYDINDDTTGSDLKGDSLTGDIKMFLDVLILNANRVFGANKWVLGAYPVGTKTITLTFSESDSCLSVLQNLCNEYGQEFEILPGLAGVRTINIGNVGSDFGYTVEYGKGKGLY